MNMMENTTKIIWYKDVKEELKECINLINEINKGG